ncbi:DNA polymerase III subunit delta [Phocaeicola coprocola]|uniref:DNA polymerase III subunit n=1 Tax=Phocaeicola coprocola TaxID=310298 RepID=UPI002942844E|nr:DNA polymerase III subunit delta [Phocaeicola coprocola]
MFFKDVIGQTEAKRHLLTLVHEGRVPHAILFCGAEGTGKLPLALALTRYLCCENPGEEDACGKCPSCIKMNKQVHPDVHFAFPVIKKKAGRDTVSDDFIDVWRQQLIDSPYFSLANWLARMGAENQQAQIFVRESDEIQRKLSLKAGEGSYKIMIIWLPEKMNAECGNKLLKLLEEPPAYTIFLLVSEAPESILPTLTSRMQRFNLPPLNEEDIAGLLRTRYMLQPEDASDIAHLSAGSVLRAIENIHLGEENRLFFELFTSLMRLAYARRLKDMKAWSEQVAALGRERQKNLLAYCQRMIRENFIYNFHHSEMNYLGREEAQFASRFAPFVNERNVIGIMEELEEAGRHIEQNVNPKFVFFDFALKMIVLLKN